MGRLIDLIPLPVVTKFFVIPTFLFTSIKLNLKNRNDKKTNPKRCYLIYQHWYDISIFSTGASVHCSSIVAWIYATHTVKSRMQYARFSPKIEVRHIHRVTNRPSTLHGWLIDFSCMLFSEVSFRFGNVNSVMCCYYVFFLSYFIVCFCMCVYLGLLLQCVCLTCCW